MSKDVVEMDGLVVEALKNAMFRVKLENNNESWARVKANLISLY